MAKKLLYILLILIIIFLVVWLLFMRSCVESTPVMLVNNSGITTTEFQLNESIIITIDDLLPATGYNVRVVNERNEVIRKLVLSTDREGKIPSTVLWYNIGTENTKRNLRNSISVSDNIDYSYANTKYTIEVLLENEIVLSSDFVVTNFFQRPYLFASDISGHLKSGFLIGEEDVWVCGKNFPKGSIIRIWAVPAKSEWNENDILVDKTDQYGYNMPPIFELKATESNFKKLLWSKNKTSLGSYDLVAEVVSYDFGRFKEQGSAIASNVVSYKSYSGFVVQRRPGAAEPLEVDIAGAVSSPFTFRNTFLTNEDVYVGVDPCLQPTYVGSTANIYIVPDKSDAQWTQAALNGTNLAPLDVTGTIETITVGGICGNCWKTLAWTAPLVPGHYDVVLDFNTNGKYDPGIDLIDALDPIGFIVSEIRINTISFNYTTAGAITIFDNLAGNNIAAPEYYSANHIVKPAAWVKGGSHKVKAEFNAIPSMLNAQVWAEGILMNLNSSASPITVNFSGGVGTAEFNVNSSPADIGKYTFSWDWKYKNANGSTTSTVEMGETGEHLLYVTYALPNAPMTTPWLEPLDQACIWANGLSDITAARTAITSGLNAIGDLDGDIDYVTSGSYTGGSFAALTLDLTQFLADLKTRTNITLHCADCAGAFQVYCNAIGLDMGYVIINIGHTTNYIDPIGNGFPGNSTSPVQNWQTIYWTWHCVGHLPGNILYDACLHLDGDSNPSSTPNVRLLPANLSHSSYCNTLMPVSGYCNLSSTNVVSVY